MLSCALVVGAPAATAQIAVTSEPPVLVPDGNEAIVWFYRTRGPYRNDDFWIFTDENPVGVLKAREYTGAAMPPGEHLLWVYGELARGLYHAFEPGQTYYFEVVASRATDAGFRIRPAANERAAASDMQKAEFRELTAAGREQAGSILERAYSTARDAAKAERLLHEAFEGGHEPGSPEQLRAIYAAIDEFEAQGERGRANGLLRCAIRLIRQHRGESSVLLVDPLMRLSGMGIFLPPSLVTPEPNPSDEQLLLYVPEGVDR